MTPNILTKLRKNPIIEYCLTLNQELFLVMLATYLLLLLLETISDGFVSSHLNLNQLLTIVIISGTIALLTGKKEIVKDSMSTKKASPKLKLILKINPIDLLNQKIMPKISSFLTKCKDHIFTIDEVIPEYNKTPNINQNILTKFREKPIINHCLKLNQELFSVMLVTYLLLLLLETIWEGFISLHLNLNQLLIIVIITGAIAVLTGKEDYEIKKEKESITTKDHIFIIGAGILGSGIIYYKIQETGWLSYVISAMAGILIILLSILILEDENDEDSEDVNTRVQ
jgi:hypothetical protein